MFAVIQAGGKQYRVRVGEGVQIEKLEKNPGDSVVFDKVLMVDDGKSVTMVNSELTNARVEGTLLENDRYKKIIVFKKNRRKNYKRKNGHRQNFSRVQITSISV